MRSGPPTWEDGGGDDEGWAGDRPSHTETLPDPRMQVVLPAPRSPLSNTTSPACRRIPRSRPSSTIASAVSDLTPTIAEGESPDTICDLVLGFELDHGPVSGGSRHAHPGAVP